MLYNYLKEIGFSYLLDGKPMKAEHSGSDLTFEEIIEGYQKIVNKDLQHYKDSSLGLHCTDRPDLIIDENKILFELKQ